MLYSEPDFVAEALLRTLCESHGVPVLFLPKFHCELNFIEQCWGYAKRRYRMAPESSKEENLERNVLASLEEVPLISMRR
jgi:transposase